MPKFLPIYRCAWGEKMCLVIKSAYQGAVFRWRGLGLSQGGGPSASNIEILPGLQGFRIINLHLENADHGPRYPHIPNYQNKQRSARGHRPFHLHEVHRHQSPITATEIDSWITRAAGVMVKLCKTVSASCSTAANPGRPKPKKSAATSVACDEYSVSHDATRSWTLAPCLSIHLLLYERRLWMGYVPL